VKLLFDQNLSPRLAGLLADLFAGSLHVGQVGLERADDDAIWRYARDRGFAIVTKDSDFQERSQLAASTPRIVWIRRGNCSTQDIETLLRTHAVRIAALESEADTRFLVLL
jgi:predicted nuclease of predicted toxin-antitoxin system